MPPQRSRKRGIPMGQDDAELESKKRKPQMQVGVETAEALKLVVSAIRDRQSGRRSNIEQAIQLLEEKYQQRISAADFIDAIGILESNSKASVFITLKSSELRDR